MNISNIMCDSWSSIRGTGSEKTPEENMSLCAEIFISHDHFDDVAPAAMGSAEGVMTDR